MEPEAPAQREELIWETIACERRGGGAGAARGASEMAEHEESRPCPQGKTTKSRFTVVLKNPLYFQRGHQTPPPRGARGPGDGQRRPSSRRPRKPSDRCRALTSWRPRETVPPAGRHGHRLLPRVPAKGAALSPPGKIEHLYLYYIDKSISCNFSCNRQSSGNTTRADTLNVISLPCDSRPTPTKLTSW